MFLLCTGKSAEKPYKIPYTDTGIYSLEELCYYLYHNIYSVTEEFFQPQLLEWLRQETNQQVLAKKLTSILSEENPDLKDLVVTVLCSSDYYRENEIREIVKVIDDMSQLPFYAKKKIKADNYLRYGRYGKAAAAYRKLLDSSLAVNFTPDEYGNIFHNMGIAHFYTSSFYEAEKDFKEAYVRNHSEKSGNHYLNLLLLEGKNELFEAEALSMGRTPDEIRVMQYTFEAMKRETEAVSIEEDFATRYMKQLREAFTL